MSDFEVSVVVGVIGLLLVWGSVLAGLALLVVRYVRERRRQRARGGVMPREVFIAASAGRRSEIGAAPVERGRGSQSKCEGSHEHDARSGGGA